MQIHISSSSFRPGLWPIHTIIIDGERYTNINDHLLACLRRGMTPMELEMEPDLELEREFHDDMDRGGF